MSASLLLAPLQKSTVTDQVFQAVYSAIVTLELAPGSKVSEAEIAKSLGVSRQPVRDAFYRLSELGFIRIRPQRATTITFISEQSLKDAMFIRIALEVECMRSAIKKITNEEIDVLEDLLKKQATAIETGELLAFHKLDNEFHRAICMIGGNVNAWNLIWSQKVHMERVRYLSLAVGAQSACDQHYNLLDYIKARDIEGAVVQLREHLSRVLVILRQVKQTNSEYFDDDEA